ncbi:MAG: exonuclease SbcCD subunit D [Armatimonadota bacterium]
MKALKLLHTGDVHLGTSSAAFGERAAAHRAQLERTFGRIIDLALEEQCDLLLVSGDLFDASRPGRRLVRFVVDQLARLAERTPPTCACVLPGTHDCYGPGTVYADAATWGGLRHVHVFTPDALRFDLPDVSASVYGRACRCAERAANPLEDVAPATDMQYHVALAHGWVGGAPPGGEESEIIPTGAIDASGMHYIALGHQHAFADCSEGGTKAFYCGVPEPVAIDQTDAGAVALVRISPEGDVEVGRKEVGSLRAQLLSLDVGAFPSRDSLTSAIAENADSNLILDVELAGVAAPEVLIDANELAEELADGFFRLRVRDGSHVALDRIRLEDYPEELVEGKFVRKMMARIDEAKSAGDEDAVALAERALRVGLALLAGGGGD